MGYTVTNEDVETYKEGRGEHLGFHTYVAALQAFVDSHPEWFATEPRVVTDDLRTAVFEAIGAASTCWDNLHGAGVFESDRARQIGESLLSAIAATSATGSRVATDEMAKAARKAFVSTPVGRGANGVFDDYRAAAQAVLDLLPATSASADYEVIPVTDYDEGRRLQENPQPGDRYVYEYGENTFRTLIEVHRRKPVEPRLVAADLPVGTVVHRYDPHNIMEKMGDSSWSGSWTVAHDGGMQHEFDEGGWSVVTPGKEQDRG